MMIFFLQTMSVKRQLLKDKNRRDEEGRNGLTNSVADFYEIFEWILPCHSIFTTSNTLVWIDQRPNQCDSFHHTDR